MKKAVMKLLVKALRSKKFKQGSEFLKIKGNKKGPKHCCLGVLCEIQRKHNKDITKVVFEECDVGDSIMFKKKVYSFNNCSVNLPEEVVDWAGMKTPTGIFKIKGEVTSLVSLNDYKGYSFKQIANVIEKHYKKL